MYFFEAEDGRQYPVESISTIYPHRVGDENRYGVPKSLIKLKNDDSVYIIQPFLERLMMQPVHTLPAAPGTFLLQFFPAVANEVETTFRIAVIGWAVGLDGHLRPITADGVNDGDGTDWSILSPDGSVTRAGDMRWPSIEAWRSEQHADAAAK